MAINTSATDSYLADLKEVLIVMEGHGLTLYPDSIGIPTIGVGYALIIDVPFSL